MKANHEKPTLAVNFSHAQHIDYRNRSFGKLSLCLREGIGRYIGKNDRMVLILAEVVRWNDKIRNVGVRLSPIEVL